MFEWFDSLNGLQQVFSVIAIPSTVLLIVQIIMLLFGLGDGDGDLDTGGDFDADDVSESGDFGGDGLVLFSTRTVVAFLCMAGWTGMAFAGTTMEKWLAVMLAVICGLVVFFGMAYLMKAIMSLQSEGNINITNALGKVGQVYLSVPAGAKGTGKVMVIVQDRLIEMPAMTDQAEPIKTGESVRIVSVGESGILMVESVIQDAQINNK